MYADDGENGKKVKMNKKSKKTTKNLMMVYGEEKNRKKTMKLQ